MNILIVGCGKAGAALAQTLRNEGHDVTVMDQNAELVTNLVNHYDIQGICGNGLIVKDLMEANIARTNIVIAVTESDEINILCSMMAKKSGARHCIARVRNPAYAEQLVFMREELGISMMVNPLLHTANEISRMLRYPNAIHVETFAKGRLELAELKITEGSVLDGLTLSSLGAKLKIRFLVCAVNRDDHTFIPDGSCTLQKNDKIYITAIHSEMSQLFKQIGDPHSRIRSALIVGGGKISYYLLHLLQDLGVHVKLIEQDLQTCEKLSEWFPKVKILCGDGSDQDILLEEGLADVDAFIPLTGIDEENIILSLYAKTLGVGKVITKVNRPSLLPISDSVGLEHIVSPKEMTTSLILQYVRAKQNTSSSNIATLYRLADNTLEAIEFIVRREAPYLGVPLKDLRIHTGFLLAGIIRGNKRIIPSGDDCLKLDDSVVIVTTKCKVTSLDEIFHSTQGA